MLEVLDTVAEECGWRASQRYSADTSASVTATSTALQLRTPPCSPGAVRVSPRRAVSGSCAAPRNQTSCGGGAAEEAAQVSTATPPTTGAAGDTAMVTVAGGKLGDSCQHRRRDTRSGGSNKNVTIEASNSQFKSLQTLTTFLTVSWTLLVKGSLVALF